MAERGLLDPELLSDIADAIRLKKGTENTMTPAQMASEIGTIAGGKETLSWHQCPQAVRDYLAAASALYPTAGDDVTCVNEYAPNYQNIPDAVSAEYSKPIGYTIDGVTFCDNEPHAAMPFSTANKAGTLTALDRLRWYNTTIGPALAGSSYKRGMNCRDLGGWPCDGGTIKYGVLVRSGEPNPADKALMVDKIGIKTEVQLLPLSEQADDYQRKSVWGIDWAGNDTNDSFNDGLQNTALWKKILTAVIDSVTHDRPVLFHCGIGADRTGIVAIMLEGILGVRRSDIDQDFELTNFALGWQMIDGNVYRARSYSSYIGLMEAFGSIPLVGGLTDSFRNRCVSFALSLGITADEINAFRAACIDGTPDVIAPLLDTYTVEKRGAHVAFSNGAASVDAYQGFETALTPDDGYVIDSVTVTMGGADVTADVFTGDIAKPHGAIEITANGETDVSFYKLARVNVPTGGPPVNCRIFPFSSAAAVANQDVTVVSGDADVAAHYADANAMVTVRKMTNNAGNGTAFIVGTNHSFGGGAYGCYMNCNGTANAAAVCTAPLTAASGSGVSVRCNADGDIIVHCMSKQNNFGGAEYLITFSW